MTFKSFALLKRWTVKRSSKITFTFLVFLSLFYMLCGVGTGQHGNTEDALLLYSNDAKSDMMKLHASFVRLFYENREILQTSNLGSMLFKNAKQSGFEERNKTFVVLIWKYYGWLKRRHVENFRKRQDPLQGCSVTNCKFSGSNNILNTADAVVVHLQHGLIPSTSTRNPKQRWIFLTDESPKNTFSMALKPPKLSSLANVFNWSMSYRTSSDIPVPYGRVVPLTEPILYKTNYKRFVKLIPNWRMKRKDVLATILMSNCRSKERMNYLNELRKHLKIHVYGACSNDTIRKNSCPGHFQSDCKVISKYLFYLVFENSKCKEYLTEKIFHHGYAKGLIPVIFGPPFEDCQKLLPPHSFLHVEKFKSPKHLAMEIKSLSMNKQKVISYHLWRNHFELKSEHGYFGTYSRHYCRVCEALNYNSAQISVYDESRLKTFLDRTLLCT